MFVRNRGELDFLKGEEQIIQRVGESRQHALVGDVGVIVAVVVVQLLPHLLQRAGVIELLMRVIYTLRDPTLEKEDSARLGLQVVDRVGNALLGLDLLDDRVQVVEGFDLQFGREKRLPQHRHGASGSCRPRPAECSLQRCTLHSGRN